MSEATAALSRPCRVLCVDDNPANLDLYVRALERQGHRVDVAITGAEALTRLDECDYRVLLLDMELPEIDGYEVARRVRANSRYTGLHVVGVTAHTQRGDGDKVLAAGCDFYYAKPIRLSELYELVEHCCRQPRAVE